MVWHLATIQNGLDVNGFRSGHHVYVSRTPDGRVFVLGKGDVTAVLTLAEAARRLRTVRYPDGRPVRVARQQRQCDRWFEARAGRTLTLAYAA
jgi:hypothetical protein